MGLVKFQKESFLQSFSALRHRNFRLFWFGQCISLLGTWMQQTAQTWLVYSLTKSAFLLGILGVCQYAPILLLSLFAGVYVDRFPKKKFLMTIQILMMLQAIAFTVLLYSGHIQYWHILLLSSFLGLLNTFDLPVRQSFLIEMVGRDDLMGAIALNGVIVNIARIIGPALAGIILVYGSTNLCFLINAISFVAVIFCVSFVKVEVAPITKKVTSVMTEAWAGIRYIASNKKVSKVLLSVIIVGTFAMNTSVLIPVFVKQVLHHDAEGYTTILSIMGIGSMIGAWFVSSKSKNGPNPYLLFGSALFLGLCLVVLSLVKSYALAIAITPIFGLLNMVFLISANSTIQLSIENEYRGRVMSIYGLAFMGTTPIGNFYAGTITEYFGANIGFLICGVTTIFCLLILLFQMRRSKQNALSL
jgi:MFS family permease